jgi:hypothetical protein
MADLAFDAAGNLFGVASIGGPDVYSINVATGQASLVGPNGASTSTGGGGFAISPSGTYFGTPTSSRFGTYNAGTGAFTNIVTPTLPVGGGYAALAFNGAGTLFGLDLGPSSGGLQTALVTLDTTTGAVTNLGPSIVGLDAVAFQPIPEPGSLLLVAGPVALGLWRRTRRSKLVAA